MLDLDVYGHLRTLELEREHLMRQSRSRAPQELRPRHTVRTRAALTLHTLADHLERSA